MLRFLMPMAAGTALLAGSLLPAAGADFYDPPVVEAPPPQVIYEKESYGGWYIRGDIGYHWPGMKHADYITYGTDGCCTAVPGTGSFDFTELKGALSLGGGVGYQITSYLRTDVTADYWFKSDFRGQTTGTCTGGVTCTSVDTTKFNALLLLANAYADLGTYYRITPYVGAGIGGAYVKWGDLRNQIPFEGIDDRHRGAEGMRFAWALMAGASYCITKNWHADLGYRFSRIAGGRMFHYSDSSAGGPGAGPGFHGKIDTHEVRAGLRYQFGGGKDECGGKQQIVYHDPEPYTPPPVYK